MENMIHFATECYDTDYKKL